MNANKEVWKDVPKFEGLYKVSNRGDVFSIKRNKVLAKQNHNSGYLMVRLYKNKCGFSILIHRLVAKAFLPNPKKLPQVNHKDGNKKNNNVKNLEWVSCRDNTIHSCKGLRSKKYKKRIGLHVYKGEKYIGFFKNVNDICNSLNIDNRDKIYKHLQGRLKTFGGYVIV